MLIKDWMTKNVFTVDENTSLMRTTRIMKEKNIRKLPVVSHGKLLGIVSDRDVKEASPSNTTSLDIHELYYLLSEMKVKEVMTTDPITMRGTDSLEKAALIMLDNKISGIPVVDDSGRIIGLLSETDVMLGFIHATGIKDGAIQYVFNLPDVPGAVTELVKVLRENNSRIISILTSYDDAGEGQKQVAVRVTVPQDKESADLTKVLEKQFSLVFSATDDLDKLPHRKG
ncbi:MAG: CBS domain-containing protein [Deltaproteobacteria bacterium]|nr:CBS domain-containing protein [Deltaproteobacteria bacterium]